MANGVDALNALIFGADNDALYLADGKVDLSKVTDLTSPLPKELEHVGWISEDGMGLEFSDSLEKIRGHQGHKVVKTYMSSSDTTLTATLLESKLKTVLRALDATAEKSGDITKITAKTARQTKLCTGVLDLFDTSGNGAQWRILFPLLQLGERESLAFKTTEMTAYTHKLEVLEDYVILTNAEAMQVTAGDSNV